MVIDGGHDWSATEHMIQRLYPWISFLHCVSHEVSLILKDCFKKDGGIPELYALDQWVTDAQHWFSTHAIASLRRTLKQDGEASGFVWPAVTRYCGVLLKLKRFFEMRHLLRRVVNSGVYQEKNFADDHFPRRNQRRRQVTADGQSDQDHGSTAVVVPPCRRTEARHIEAPRHTTLRPDQIGGSGTAVRTRLC